MCQHLTKKNEHEIDDLIFVFVFSQVYPCLYYISLVFLDIVLCSLSLSLSLRECVYSLYRPSARGMSSSHHKEKKTPLNNLLHTNRQDTSVIPVVNMLIMFQSVPFLRFPTNTLFVMPEQRPQRIPLV